MSQDDGLYDLAESYHLLIKTCGKLLSQTVNKAFADAGYAATGSQWAILTHLRDNEGISQQALADLNNASKVTAFRLIERLEEQGFLKRRPDPDDGRRKLVFLTKEGLSLQKALTPLVEKNAERLSRDIGLRELEIMKDALRKIAENATRTLLEK